MKKVYRGVRLTGIREPLVHGSSQGKKPPVRRFFGCLPARCGRLLGVLLILLAGAGLAAQSLEKNEYYKKSLEYADRSQQSLDSGAYDEAIEYAQLSQEYATRSKQYIEEMLLAYRARSAYVAAKARMDLAGRLNLRGRAAAVYDEAAAYFTSAETRFNTREYENSIPDSQKVVELLRDFEIRYPIPAAEPSPPPPSSGLAASYEVKLIPHRRDCLWRIAEYDFVYGDPRQWPRLYEANKDKFPQPDNPHLIVPGMILTIPSIHGEQRSGER
jgi:nucleoid-associated protein YgaU